MRTLGTTLALLLLLAACGDGTNDTPAAPPDRVVVDHILIGVQGRIPNGKPPAEARTLAYDLLKQIEAGADWATLKQKHSDDPPPGGPYTMLETGRPDHARMIYMRGEMAPAFGDVGFSLEVGEVGMADYEPRRSPFGYHIIKRIE